MVEFIIPDPVVTVKVNGRIIGRIKKVIYHKDNSVMSSTGWQFFYKGSRHGEGIFDTLAIAKTFLTQTLNTVL